MSGFLLQKASAPTIVFKAFLASDHVSNATGKTIAITISKNGGAFGNPNAGATNATEISAGFYKVALDATDTGTAGHLAIKGTEGTIDDVAVIYQVTDPTVAFLGANAVQINAVSTSSVTTVNANIGSTQPLNFTGTGASALVKGDTVDIAGAAVSTSTAQLGVNVVNFGGSAGTFASGRPEVNTSHIAGSAVSTSSAQIGVNVVQAGATAWNSGAIKTTSFTAGAIDAAAIAADAIGASELAADAVTEIAAGISIPSASTVAAAVWDLDATAHQTQGTFGQAIGDPVADTNTIFKAVVTDATGVTVGTDTASMLASGNPVSSGGITTASFAAGAIDAAAIATDAIGSAELAASAATEIANAVLTTQMTESYATDGTAPTLAQSLMLIQQFQAEKNISGTTMTVKKIDGSTTAATFTLNSSSTPTSITRAS